MTGCLVQCESPNDVLEFCLAGDNFLEYAKQDTYYGLHGKYEFFYAGEAASNLAFYDLTCVDEKVMRPFQDPQNPVKLSPCYQNLDPMTGKSLNTVSKFRKVAFYENFHETNFTDLNDLVVIHKIDWLGQTTPLNEPICGYKNDKCVKSTKGKCYLSIIFCYFSGSIVGKVLTLKHRKIYKFWLLSEKNIHILLSLFPILARRFVFTRALQLRLYLPQSFYSNFNFEHVVQ